MEELSDTARPRKDSMPPWVWVLGVVVVVAGFGIVRLLANGAGDPSLPPGFTITSVSDSGSEGPGRRAGAEGRSLGSLIAAASPSESDRFEASIAIMPMENRTGDTVLDTLGDGMTEELIARLSRIRGLKVISLQSVKELEGLDLTVAEVADTLDVGHVLVGTAFPHQDEARIEVRLLEAEQGRELWGNDYSLDRANQLRAVEEISDELGQALLAEVPTLSLRTSAQTTESPGYVAYLAGNRLLNTRTGDGLARAIEAFQSAIAEDSSFAPAYAGLSSAYALSITYRYDIGVDAYAAAGLALAAAERAIGLDPELAEGYAARGYISSVALAPAQVALEDFTQAMELQPNAPNVPAWLANLLVREGYYDQALAQAQTAVALDPLSPARRTGLAYEALRARDYGLAIEQARAARSLSSTVVLPQSIQAIALLLSGRAEECLDLDLGPHDGLRAICMHALGRVERAEVITDSLRAVLRSGEQAHPDFTNVIQAGDLAAYLAWTGYPERSMRWIHRAYALSPSGIDPRTLNSGIFESVLEDGQMRREISGIQDRIWDRVRRELAEAELEVGPGPP